MKDRIRVATWNVHGCRDSFGSHFDCWQLLEELKVDIVSLQEVEVEGHIGTEAWLRSAAVHGYSHCLLETFSPSPFDVSLQIGVALLSRFPIICSSVYVLPNPALLASARRDFHDKGFIKAQISIGDRGRIIEVVALHSHPFYLLGMDERLPVFQPLWSALDNALSGRVGELTIALGDFNTERRHELLRVLSSGEMASLSKGMVTRDRGDSHDDILISSHFSAESFEIVPGQSDHYLLCADLSVKRSSV